MEKGLKRVGLVTDWLQIGYRLDTDWSQNGDRLVTDWSQTGHRLVTAGISGYKVVTKWSHSKKPT